MTTVPMLVVATMQRSDSDPDDTTSLPIEVGPLWCLCGHSIRRVPCYRALTSRPAPMSC